MGATDEHFGRVDTALVVSTASRKYHFDSGIGLAGSREYWNDILLGEDHVAVVTSSELSSRFENVLAAMGTPRILTVPDGESAKSLEVVGQVYDRLAESRFPRTGVIVGLGGGSVTDLAGFVAGTWKRGVRLIQVATTLTSQVDAALGGKSAVNLAEGKNLVGVIYQPERVVADRSVLSTLPQRDFRGGMAEIIKCGFIGDPKILDLVDGWSRDRDLADPRLRELINRSVRVKLDLIEQDELDLNIRRHLNYGHTLGQALETATDYRGLNHGEAVGLGMIFASAVSELSGGASGLLELTRRHLRDAGLPTTAPPAVKFETLWALMGQDKKAGLAGREFVVCERPGNARLRSMPGRDLAQQAFAEL